MDRATLLGIMFALGTGVCIAFQAPINSLLSKEVGLLEGAFFVLTTGAAVTGVALMLGLGTGDLGNLRHASPVVLLGGPLGVCIVIGIVLALTRFGVVAAATITLISQFILSALIDHFGLFGVERAAASLWTILGILMLVTGAVLIRL